MGKAYWDLDYAVLKRKVAQRIIVTEQSEKLQGVSGLVKVRVSDKI